MVYVSSGGQVVDSQSPWRLSIIPEIFWGIINFVVLFFRTLVSPSMTKYGNTHTSDYRSGGGGPPPPPRRRMGGFRGGGGGAPSAPPMGGG
ncbi:selenoprotein K-like [Crassostrea virginica]|uniref:Selenoprotein K-like n=1 Tax=Crassostrea virginica TaxID=6565 RepID=A0A8B8B854_CRAVI|nr:selenoprotein K-like [Crassostrea virginica]XP_022299786.1 selenoprotein K-like [Crassostrea virginica]